MAASGHAPRALARVAASALVLAWGVLAARRASGQFPQDQPTRLPALGRSAVSDDDSTALVVNPANLGFLPREELRWTGMFLNENATASYQGHAFALAFPIRSCLWRLACGSIWCRRRAPLRAALWRRQGPL